jgi:hypothetical protein
MKSAAIVAAVLALSATVMPAEPLPVAKPGPSQGAQQAMSSGTCAWSSTAPVRRWLRHRSARHNAIVLSHSRDDDCWSRFKQICRGCRRRRSVGGVQNTYTPPTQFGLFGILAVLLATFPGIVVFSRSNWLLNLKIAKAARTRAREVPQTSHRICTDWTVPHYCAQLLSFRPRPEAARPGGADAIAGRAPRGIHR